jgi:hypothetical protein
METVTKSPTVVIEEIPPPVNPIPVASGVRVDPVGPEMATAGPVGPVPPKYVSCVHVEVPSPIFANPVSREYANSPCNNIGLMLVQFAVVSLLNCIL